MSDRSEIATLRARLDEGMAFVPAKLVRALMEQYDAKEGRDEAAIFAAHGWACQSVEEACEALDDLCGQARVSAFERVESERTLRDTASELLRIASEINSRPANNAAAGRPRD